LRLECLEGREMLSWTVMVYMDADDAGPASLANYIAGNFAEMASAGSTAEVKIVAQIDSIGSASAFSGQAGAWRGLIQRGDQPTLNWGTSLGNVDSGNPQSLIDFTDWATLNYPADNYALILWDHGNGFAGVCYDDTSKSYLSMMDVTQAMNAIGHVDLLAFDACLMGMVEVASQFRNEADVMVASEETIPATGYDYRFLAALVADPAMEADALGAAIVDAYAAYYGAGGGNTLAAINMSQIGNSSSGLSGAMETFANTMITAGTPADWNGWITARNASYKYNYNPQKGHFPGHDINELMTRLRAIGGISAPVYAAAGDVITAMNACVIKAYHGAQAVGTGLTVFSPAPGDRDLWPYYTCDLSFIVDTQWIQIADPQGPAHAPGAAMFANAGVSGQVDMYVFGTDGADTFTFKQVAGGRIQLRTSLSGWSKIYSPPKGKFIGQIVVQARGGNDIVTFDTNMTRGAIIYCGPGNDRVTTRGGSDEIFGGAGDDIIDSGEGDDQLAGGDGNDTLYARGGNDRLNGGAGNDYLAAGAGNDVAYGAVGADRIWGEAGNDVLIGGTENDEIRELSGYNRIFGGQGDDRLYGGTYIDAIYGSLGNDLLLGGASSDMLSGGLGANLLIGGLGADLVRGRGGDNILIGGTTGFDNNDAALLSLLAEWSRPLPRVTRIAHLDGTLAGGLNGKNYLRKTGTTATVFSDKAANKLYGNLSDWFLNFDNDQILPPV
jgi:hypothetical protein